MEKQQGEQSEKRALEDVELPMTKILNCYRKFKPLFKWAVKILMFLKLILTFFSCSTRETFAIAEGNTYA